MEKINSIFEQLEFYRYGVMAMTLTAGSCWGSAAVLFMAKNDAPMWEIAACAAISMGANSMAIALAPMKILMWTFVASVIVNGLLIVVNL